MEKNNNIVFSDWKWQEVLLDSSKSLVLYSINMVRSNPELFPSLFELAMSEEGKYSQRASRVVYYLIEKEPELYSEYIDVILTRMAEIRDISIKFNFLKIFTICPLPQDEGKLGLLSKISFDAIEANVERIALKVYAAEVLYRISQVVPDLKREVMYVLEKYMPGAKMAYVSRAGKIIGLLKKELKNPSKIKK